MQSRPFLLLILALGLVASPVPLFAQSDQGLEARQFGLGQPATIDELPPGN
jgi:hypothetical protein